MTKTIFLLSMIMTLAVSAQSAVGLSMYQDVKLAFDKDDGHGNKAFTPDFLWRITLQGQERAIGHSLYGVSYEWADLYAGDFHRYSTMGGYTFTNLPVPLTDIKYSTTVFVGAGVIIRDGLKPFSPEAGIILSFKMTSWLKLNQQAYWMQRTDLPNNKFGFNYGWGVQCDIDTDYLKPKNGKNTRF